MRNLKKNLLSIILSLCLVTVSFLGVANAQISTTSSMVAYKNFLQNNKSISNPYTAYKLNYFATVDLDKNGVKELIMIDKTNKVVTVYTYANKKVKYCGNMYDRQGLYMDKLNRLSRVFENSGEKMSYYLTLNSKKQLYLVGYTYDKIEKKYYKVSGLVEGSEDYNRVKISKKTYNKEVKKLAFNKSVNKHLNNKANRNKYLK